MLKKKKNFGRIIPPFFFESSESDRFSIIYMIRIRFFRVGGINSENISARTVRATGAAPTFRFNNIHLCYRPSRKYLYQNFNVSFVDVFLCVGRAVSKGRASSALKIFAQIRGLHPCLRRVHICWVSDSCANLSGLEPSHSSMEASRPLFVVECAVAGSPTHVQTCQAWSPAITPWKHLDLYLSSSAQLLGACSCAHMLCLRRSISFRKKLDIYNFVPGDSDHHPCMMQSTIRGKLTRLLRANSSVDSFEQELKFFRLKWTRRGHDGKEFDRNPWLAKKTLVGGPKTVKPKQNTTFPGVCVIDKHVKVAQSFFGRECKPIVARTVAPNLFRRMYSESGLTVCDSFFWGCAKSQK